jgi:catechol 2,3-dioxygenase-like lactoylglutathione lyase family enzyme
MDNFYSRTVFFVKDGDQSLRFYTEQLGFSVDWNSQAEGRSYVFQVGLFGFELIVNQADQQTLARAGQGRVFIGLEDDQIEALHQHIAARGIQTQRVEWGRPTLVITDLDGNELFFWDWPDKGKPAPEPTGMIDSLRAGAPDSRTAVKPRTQESQPQDMRVTSFAPQFLVDNLERSMTWYQKLGFTFGKPWNGFYAIGDRDGLELHLKQAPKNAAERQYRREHEHLDAAAGVDGIEAFYEQCLTNGVKIFRPLLATAWGSKDFYVEDPDGYIISFGGRQTPKISSGLP